MSRKPISQEELLATADAVDRLGSRQAAAQELGLHYQTVCRRLQKLGRKNKTAPPKKPLAQIERDYWQRYVNGGRKDDALRNVLIDFHLPRLRKLASKEEARLCQRIPMDDLFQEGVSALLDCATRYDPACNNSFWTFASHRCRGAMMDFVRKADHVPRLTRARDKERREAESALLYELGREPSQIEVCNHLGWSEKKYANSFLKTKESIDKSREDAKGREQSIRDSLSACLDDPADIFATESRIRRLLQGLPMDDQVMAWLYYARGVTMKKIASAYDLGESRISQRMAVINERLVRSGAKERRGD